MIYILGASIALNLLLLYLWRTSRWYLMELIYHVHKRYGFDPYAKELDEDYDEFWDGTTLWDKLFG